MKSLMERIAQGEVLISDGAMGTFLHAKGPGPASVRNRGVSRIPT